MSKNQRIGWTGHTSQELVAAGAAVGVDVHLVDEDYETPVGTRIGGRFVQTGIDRGHRRYTYVETAQDWQTVTDETARLDKQAAQVVRQAELIAGSRAEWTKEDDRWVVIGSGLAVGSEVTVTRANGSKSIETVKAIVGDRGGLTLAEVF